MEELTLLHVVAIDELLVAEDVAVGVEDPLGESRGPRRVVDLGRVVGGGVDRLEALVLLGEQLGVENDHLVDQRTRHPVDVVGVGDDHLRLGVPDPVLDPLVAVEDRQGEQDGAGLPGAEEHRSGLG